MGGGIQEKHAFGEQQNRFAAYGVGLEADAGGEGRGGFGSKMGSCQRSVANKRTFCGLETCAIQQVGNLRYSFGRSLHGKMGVSRKRKAFGVDGVEGGIQRRSHLNCRARTAASCISRVAQ